MLHRSANWHQERRSRLCDKHACVVIAFLAPAAPPGKRRCSLGTTPPTDTSNTRPGYDTSNGGVKHTAGRIAIPGGISLPADNTWACRGGAAGAMEKNNGKIPFCFVKGPPHQHHLILKRVSFLHVRCALQRGGNHGHVARKCFPGALQRSFLYANGVLKLQKKDLSRAGDIDYSSTAG